VKEDMLFSSSLRSGGGLDVITLIVASVAFALYVTCPRMTAMIATESKISGLNPILTVILGCILGIPLFLILLYTFQHLGVAATVLLAAIFDFGAALLLGSIDIKGGIELIIITVFVYAGIRLAPMIAELILKIL